MLFSLCTWIVTLPCHSSGEARAELSAVTERIAQRKADEKKAMQGLFTARGKGLYDDEEKKRLAKLAEEKRKAEQKAEEEAAKVPVFLVSTHNPSSSSSDTS